MNIIYNSYYYLGHIIIKFHFNEQTKLKCGENRNHCKFQIYFLMVEL